MIKKEGEPVTLHRGTTPALPMIAFVRDYRADELVGAIQQGDRQVQMSNVEIAAANWPAPPKRMDVVMIDGKRTTVQSAETVKLRGKIAKYVVQVRG